LNHRDHTLRARVEQLLAAIVMGPGHPIGPQNDENIRFWLLMTEAVWKRDFFNLPIAATDRQEKQWRACSADEFSRRWPA
jgi:hypothetical protein